MKIAMAFSLNILTYYGHNADLDGKQLRLYAKTVFCFAFP